jgi:hypothetical protein
MTLLSQENQNILKESSHILLNYIELQKTPSDYWIDELVRVFQIK